MFKESRSQTYRSWKEELFISLYQALIICEMIDPYTSMSVRVACAVETKGKYD